MIQSVPSNHFALSFFSRSWPFRPSPTMKVHRDAYTGNPPLICKREKKLVLPSWKLSRKSNFLKMPPTITSTTKLTGSTSTGEPMFQYHLSFGMGLQAPVSPSRPGGSKRCSIADKAKTVRTWGRSRYSLLKWWAQSTRNHANAPVESLHMPLYPPTPLVCASMDHGIPFCSACTQGLLH